ncbi:MAG: DUF1573 domain-containing protein [Acidobacteria bacterium]|jgi:hypothetical protein|nr:DUF1573 domain-containing protein [Acidobacteriota bacterium]
MRKRIAALLGTALAIFAFASFAQETPPQPPPATPLKIKPINPQPGQSKMPVKQGEGQPAELKPVQGSEKPPKLVINKTEFDAGAISKGSPVQAEFILENKGEGTLQIQRVQPACGCTVASFDHEIAPGKSGKISATVNTQAYQGPIVKTIQVFTNDQAMQNFQLTIKADVKAILSVQPSENQQCGLVFEGQPVEKEFTIHSEDNTPFKITQVQTEDTKLRYDVTSDKDGLTAHFKVTVPANYPVGPITGRFVLSTTHPKAPTLNLNVFGTIREPLTVYPKEVVFPGLSKDYIMQNPEDPALNKLVTVAFETGPELKVNKVESSVPFLAVTSEATTPDQRYSIKIHLDPKKVKEGEFDGKVTIATNKKVIVIPVSGRIF